MPMSWSIFVRNILLGITFMIFPVSGQAESLAKREVRVIAAVSPGFQTLPSWKPDFEKRLAYASRIFESEFKIKFRITHFVQWAPSDEAADMVGLLEEVRSQVPLGDADIVIGLTHYQLPPETPNLKDLHTLGQARPFTGHLVIRYPANKLYRVQEETVLVHELGHVFGAVHTDDPKSIMSPVVDRQLPVRFDEENKKIINATRLLNLNRGAESLPPHVLQGLLRSYLKMIGKNGSGDFFYSIGLFYLQLGQPSEAIKSWKMAVNSEPENSEWHYNLGALYLKAGDYERAISELSHSVSGLEYRNQKQMKKSALTLLGDSYFAKENMFAASNAWTRALALKPGDIDLEASLAMVKFKQGQTENAVDSFRSILKKDPQNLKALTYLGKALAKQEKYSEALEYLTLALTQLNRQPKSSSQLANLSTLYGDIGSIYMKQNRQKEAVESYQAACDLTPSADCHKQLGTMLFNNQQWSSAVTEFAKVIQTQKEDADVYGMMGTALSQNGDLPNAVGVFKEGLKYAKETKMQARLHRNIANLYLSQKGYDLAEPEFNLALSKDWGDIDSHFGLAMAQLGKEQTVSAVNSLRDVLRIDPNNQRAKTMLSQIQASMNNENG